MDVWTFGEPHDGVTAYADGSLVPHREQSVSLNGEKIGSIEIHMHKRRGRDKKTDVSFGITAVVYGPASGGN